MIKSVSFGLWSCIVAIGAAYLGLIWSLDVNDDNKVAAKSVKLTQVSMRQVSVPIASNGQVKGYVVAKLGYVARADLLAKLEIKPEAFLFDAVFSAIFARKELDITTVDQKTLADFSQHVREKVNGHLGSEVVQKVFIEELGYLPFEQTRGRTAPTSGNPSRSAIKAGSH